MYGRRDEDRDQDVNDQFQVPICHPSSWSPVQSSGIVPGPSSACIVLATHVRLPTSFGTLSSLGCCTSCQSQAGLHSAWKEDHVLKKAIGDLVQGGLNLNQDQGDGYGDGGQGANQGYGDAGQDGQDGGYGDGGQTGGQDAAYGDVGQVSPCAGRSLQLLVKTG